MIKLVRPIPVRRNEPLYERSLRSLNGKFCHFTQYDGSGNEIEVEGFITNPGYEAREGGTISFLFPGDDKSSAIRTQDGNVEIRSLGDATIVEETNLDGKLKIGESLKMGSSEAPACLSDMSGMLRQLRLGSVYRVIASIDGNKEIFSGEVNGIDSQMVMFGLNFGSQRSLPLNGITEADIRRIAKIKIG